MTGSDQRRRRIVRIRTVEHRIAQQQLANAHRTAQQIEQVVERIDALRRDTNVGVATVNGASLAAISEMSVRLEQARRSTSGPLDQALRQVANRQSDNIRAQTKVENASRLLAKSIRQTSADAEARENAARCFRLMAMDEEV